MVTFKAKKPVTVAQLKAVGNQICGVLAKGGPTDRGLVRDAYVAMVCHFVVLRQTGLAGISSQDEQVMAEVMDMFTAFSVRLFDGNILDCEIRNEGLFRPGPATDAAR
jgi:hypothetical protein